jgi:hypothetical protein
VSEQNDGYLAEYRSIEITLFLSLTLSLSLSLSSLPFILHPLTIEALLAVAISQRCARRRVYAEYILMPIIKQTRHLCLHTHTHARARARARTFLHMQIISSCEYVHERTSGNGA